MSISMPTVTPVTQTATGDSFETRLNIAKSSQILADHMKQNGQSAIFKHDLQNLANNSSVPAEVSAAASYMMRHEDVFTAIETHDVAGADNLSGVWNLEWAANGGLDGTAIDAIAKMQDTFDRAIEKSSEITEKTTEAKTELDATKQRPQN